MYRHRIINQSSRIVAPHSLPAPLGGSENTTPHSIAWFKASCSGFEEKPTYDIVDLRMIPIKHANSENNSRQWMIMVHVNNTITTPMNIIISYPTMCPLSSPLLSRTTATRRLLRCLSTFSGRKRYSRKLSISFTRQPIVSTREHLRSKICAMVGSHMSSGCKTPPVG